MNPTPLALAPDIDDFRQQFEQLSADAATLINPLGDAQFNWHAAPAAWSIGECVEHLNTTARLYLPRLDEAIADAIRRGMYGDGPYSYNWLGRVLVALMEPPARLKLKSPEMMRPAANRPRAEVMAAFRAYQVQFVDRLRQANGLDLARAKVSSPTARWLRFSLGSGFGLMTAHERRHLYQVRKLTERPDFPR